MGGRELSSHPRNSFSHKTIHSRRTSFAGWLLFVYLLRAGGPSSFYLGELLPPLSEWEMVVSDNDMVIWYAARPPLGQRVRTRDALSVAEWLGGRGWGWAQGQKGHHGGYGCWRGGYGGR